MKLKAVIAGGGTGGHIFPAIAIAAALEKAVPGIELLFVGASGKMEMEKVPAAGYKIIGLTIAGFNRSNILKNITLPFKLIKSFFQVRSILASFKPDFVVGVGGYSTFPVLKMAQAKGIPTFIHEANSFAGKSNQMLAKNATAIFTGTGGMETFFPSHKLFVTGNPVRENIIAVSHTREAAHHFFGLDPNKKTILIVGGSLGANSINEVILKNLDGFASLNLQLVWQTGKTNAAKYAAAATSHANIWVGAFIAEMDMAYAVADTVISRAGAMSVAEICVAAKPAVFVPFPYAAEDHQTANANYLVKNNAALLVPDAQAAATLFNTVTALALNSTQQETFIKNLQPLAIKNAAEVVVTKILENLGA
jgi:UDP-N-acetylglucosamine--N-acetylmuramyl-(pentapeptide) pyrophosphoryl-undecaprenol N-acetylglucosamine transferase